MNQNEDSAILDKICGDLEAFLERGYFPHGDVSTLNPSLQCKRVSLLLHQVGQKILSERLNDVFTGLWSRSAIFVLLNSVLATPDLISRPYCVALFDIDDMRGFNIDLGYEEGDKILLKLAETIRLHVHPVHWVGRWGGDEFLAIFNCDMENAKNLIEMFRERLANTDITGMGLQKDLTLKVGLTSLKKGDTAQSCLHRIENVVLDHKVRNQLFII
jgi:diguanylate cyclase (GGDEF)-like protein